MILPPPNHPSRTRRPKPKALAKARRQSKGQRKTEIIIQVRGEIQIPVDVHDTGQAADRFQCLTPAEQLASAMQLLHEIQASGQQVLVDPDARPTTSMVYTHGVTLWMLMVANEMQSGCALLPQVDPMFGERNASEAEQARRVGPGSGFPPLGRSLPNGAEHASPERQRREAFSDAEKGSRADRSRIRENSECSLNSENKIS